MACDLILFNANVITMDPLQPAAELIGIAGERISCVGGNELLNGLKASGTRVVDCAGRTVLPGFVDAHCHVHAFAESLVSLDLSPAGSMRSISDIQDRIRQICRSLPPGTWIRGKGYNEFYLYEKRHPDRRDLDAAAPHHPVKLTHRSGHAHVLNSRALELAGITEETGDPPEGFLDRYAGGLPTGILYGFGSYLAGKIPPLDDSELERGIKSANEKLISFGITSIQDASFSNSRDAWRRFESWKSRGILQPRITMMTGLDAFMQSDRRHYYSRLSSDELRNGGIKIIADEITGSLHPSPGELKDALYAIHTAGRQAAIHAIEEQVIEAAADAIAYVLEKNPRRDHRHRIEHCSVCPPSLLRKLATLGVTIVTQPSFLHSSGDRYLETVPADQLEHLYPMKAILEYGIAAGAGSDFPIGHPNPLIGISSAVTRRTAAGSALPQPGISVPEAIRLHTAGAAAASFEEAIKGSLTQGKFADLVLLSENPLEMDPGDIKNIEVSMTIIGGKMVRES